MQKKYILIIGIVVILAIAGWIAWDIFGNKIDGTVSPAEVVKQSPAPLSEASNVQGGVVPSSAAIVTASLAEQQEMNLQVMAIVFAEKFGTYSNHDGYQSLSATKSMMTASTAKWLDTYIVDLQKKYGNESAVYFGITTKALNNTIVSIANDRATVSVGCQRKESVGAGEIIYNQPLKLEFKKINNEWKVDGAYWQAKES
jgi:hypothetical protein